MTLVLKNQALAGSPQQNQHHDTILAKCHSRMAFTTNEFFWNLKSGGVVALGLPHSGAHLRSFFLVFVKALGTKITPMVFSQFGTEFGKPSWAQALAHGPLCC